MIKAVCMIKIGLVISMLCFTPIHFYDLWNKIGIKKNQLKNQRRIIFKRHLLHGIHLASLLVNLFSFCCILHYGMAKDRSGGAVG